MGVDISVVIPVYKDPDGLNSTLHSLRQQNLPQHQYEILVSNDGGDTLVRDVCRQYQIHCKDIIPNQGSYKARNESIKVARGKYIALVDADIQVDPDWLAEGMQSLQHYDYVAGPVKVIRKNKMALAELYEYYSAFPGVQYMEEYHFGVTGNLFVRKEVFDRVGLFNESLRSGGDFEFGNRVYEAKDFKQKFNPKLTVLHPPRGHKSYRKKVKRVSEGLVMLAKLHPKEYNKIRPSLIKAIANIIIPPNPFRMLIYQRAAKPAIPLYFYHWYTRVLRGYYTLRRLL